MKLLSEKAKTLKSRNLETLLLKLRQTPSPFAKVKQMIQDLISRLVAEAEAEASQKTWCDAEMTRATGDRDDAQAQLEKLRASLTQNQATVDSLSEDIAELGTQIADLQKALNE